MAVIRLYTDRLCPFAHRVHIALKEIGVYAEEISIDLDAPRPAWYLRDINPAGKVPALTYKESESPTAETLILLDSSRIVEFLVDLYPSHIQPLPTTFLKNALLKYNATIFVGLFDSKVFPAWLRVYAAIGSDSVVDRVNDLVDCVREHIEPLLRGASPFLGGQTDFTMAEVHTGPLVLRLYDWSNDDKLTPTFMPKMLDQMPNFSRWAKAVRARESVTYIWDTMAFRRKALQKLPEMRDKCLKIADGTMEL